MSLTLKTTFSKCEPTFLTPEMKRGNNCTFKYGLDHGRNHDLEEQIDSLRFLRKWALLALETGQLKNVTFRCDLDHNLEDQNDFSMEAPHCCYQKKTTKTVRPTVILTRILPLHYNKLRFINFIVHFKISLSVLGKLLCELCVFAILWKNISISPISFRSVNIKWSLVCRLNQKSTFLVIKFSTRNLDLQSSAVNLANHF